MKIFRDIIVGIIAVILIFLIININDRFVEYEHRLTELETKFKICVDCSNGRQKKIGDYEWEIYKGFDFNDKNEVNIGLEIDILTEQFRWECGSIDKIVRGDREIDFNKVIQQYSQQKHLKGVTELICIGTASTEGYKDREEQRAENRMETLINLLKDNLNAEGISISGLNIGQYQGIKDTVCSDETLWQRRVIILKIIEQKSDITDQEQEKAIIRILLSKIKSNKEFPLDIRKYSKFKNGDLKLRFGRNQ